MNLFMDGFDHYSAANATQKGWNSAFTSMGTGRFGTGQYVVLATNTAHFASLKQASANTVFVGLAIAFSSAGAADVFNLYDGATVQVTLRYDPTTQVFTVYRNGVQGSGTLIATSGTVVMNVGVWYFIETKVVISDTGSVQIKVNGTSVYTSGSIDTLQSVTAQATKIGLAEFTTSASPLIDDLFVNDNSGSLNNDFIGEQRIKTIYPTAEGALGQFTPSTGTDNALVVDETLVNTTDYNSDATVGDYDTFVFQDIATTDTVKAVQITMAHQKDDVGAKEIAPVVRLAATNYDGTAVALSASWVMSKQIYETNPNTAVAWTAANVNDAEFGYKVAA